MPITEKSDNTRVQKPQVHSRIKRTITKRDKNAVIQQDNRTQRQREESHKQSDIVYNKQRTQQAQNFTGQFFLNSMNLGMPSHLIGVATSNKPWIETIGNPEVQATSNEAVNFALDMTSPSKFTKAIAFVPFIKTFKTVGETKKLLTASNYNTISKPIKDLHGMSMFDWYNRHGSLPGEHFSKFKAIMKIAEQGTKGKKGVNAELQDIAAKAKSKTPEGQAALIREKYTKDIERVNSESRVGNLQLDWSDLNTSNQLGGMPAWLKVSRVGFNERPFLDRYFNNVINKVSPKQKELINKGWLRTTKDGKHWEGFVDGQYIRVDPYRYVISHLDRAQAYGNKVNVLPESIAEIPRHGTSGRKGIGFQAKHMTNPSLEYDQTLYSVIQDGSKGANDGINYFMRNNGASIPLMQKPNLEPKYWKKGRTGDSNASGVADGAAGERVEMPKGVSDPQVGGSSMNEYNFGPGVDNIKSYWNTLDFEYGAGPLAYNKISRNNNLA